MNKKVDSYAGSALVCIVAVYAGGLLIISSHINEIQPTPYLDEIYHVPQAQEYCNGNFTYWDNRITTLPGLYLISVGAITPLSKWFGENFCETHHLRLTNVALSLSSFVVYVWLTKTIHQTSRECSTWKSIASALNLAIFPPLFFFSFLYYTDVAAAFLVFLMYGLHLRGYNIFAAIAGVAAVTVRQTSIVWVILVAVGCFDLGLQQLLLKTKERKRNAISSWHQVQMISKNFFHLAPASRKIQVISQLVMKLLPYIIVGLIFVAFVVLNDGLVVGDRAAHQATIHVPQLFYLFGLVTVFAAPHWIPLLLPFCKTCLKKWFLILITMGLAGLVIRYNTLVHPYLLADNRHYTFYIWKRVFEYQPWGRYVIIPLYLFGAFATFRTMSTAKSFIFAFAFVICCFVALVPQRLLEVRYFLIPFLFVRLHIPPRSWIFLFIEFSMYLAVNAATIYLFATRPFFWADSPLPQRFMW
ncbi:hypothetical protein GHT06_014763 [Daphnia sinensis]|uniref:Dol-P-Glc:Glc(2)Man(9)GlcNAc(2)-PP-Dol alpha-1,2-glucosyltransferase n=1 Tax=Daphnia sinensis TaxID=1820382 RepID=A0AAD5L8B5_9CRUS|nr:hypothetical protein GHT06_014763 [Daphnia sinensis]